MSNAVVLSERDLSLLRLLEMTPATAAQIRKTSITFPGEPFRDERRVRERLQALAAAELVRAWPAAISGGGLMHYYRLTAAGFRSIHPECTDAPPRTLISEIAPSRFQHALATAEVIVHTIVACHESRVRILRFHGDGRLTLSAGSYVQQPDCHFQFEQSERIFNVLFEVDNATEPVDSTRTSSIKSKLLGYEAYQDWVWDNWRRGSRQGQRPFFRVVFLTRSVERAIHILWCAKHCARNPARRLCYASTQDVYLAEHRAVSTAFLNDHHGGWQSLVNVHPSSTVLRSPIRLTAPPMHSAIS